MLNESKVKLMTRMAMYEANRERKILRSVPIIKKITGAFTPLLRSYG